LEIEVVLGRVPSDSLDWSMAEVPAVGASPYSIVDDEIGYAFIGQLSRSDVPSMMD
jgi:hypothetical protein